MEMNVLNAVSQALSFLYQTRLKKSLVATIQPHFGT
jgi:hypothetical protein